MSRREDAGDVWERVVGGMVVVLLLGRWSHVGGRAGSFEGRIRRLTCDTSSFGPPERSFGWSRPVRTPRDCVNLGLTNRGVVNLQLTHDTGTLTPGTHRNRRARRRQFGRARSAGHGL